MIRVLLIFAVLVTQFHSGTASFAPFSFGESGANRLTGSAGVPPASSSYTVGPNNRITADGTWTYQYDDEGNLGKTPWGHV